jgi:hypothetical protein
MTHFLARLVDRARGTAPRVEPIIAPRFAPVGSLDKELPQEISTEIESPIARPVGRQKPLAQKAEAARRAKKSQSDSADGHEREETTLELETKPLLVPQDRAQTQSLIVRQKNTAREIHEERRGITTVPPRVVKSRNVRANLEKSPLRLSSLLDSEPRFSDEPRGQAPIVRVTIGRIDVRAAPTPERSPRKPVRQIGPTLTLDGYLKERKEGRR